MNFYVGQKVVCVDAKGWPELVHDKIYTVLEVVSGHCYNKLYLSIDHKNQKVAPSGPLFCSKCGFKTNNYMTYSDAHAATRFVPLEDYTAAERMVTEVTRILSKPVELVPGFEEVRIHR